MLLRNYPVLLLLAVAASSALPCHGQDLQQTLGDAEVGSRWKYNDWESARAAAATSKKPIFALFR